MYAKRQQSLVDWGKQKWRTKSGKKSSVLVNDIYPRMLLEH
jgi:hypothetical protein